MASEGQNPTNADVSEGPEDMDEDSGSGCSVRIKAVEEINATVSASSSEESAKRKLPAWMQSNSEDKGTKRTKNGPCRRGNASGHEQESAVASSSNIDGISERDLQDADNMQCDQSNGQNNEADVCNEATSTNAVEEEKYNIRIKTEPDQTDACSSNIGEASGSDDAQKVEVVDASAIKTEDENSSEPASSSAVDSKVDIKVVKVEATSSTRDSCKFGIRCYRRNPQHRAEEAHPGDSDYRRPDFPDPPKGTPPCPYGDRCYRRNPIHFQSYSHPPSTDFKKNWQQRQRRQRKQKKEPDYEYDDDFIDDDDEDLEDPFVDDASDDEYVPSD